MEHFSRLGTGPSSDKVIQNTSFKPQDESLPGWKLVGTTLEESLVTGRAHSGTHYIKLKPTGGRSCVVCKPISVSGSKNYGLSWWMNMDGGHPWHWTYLTRFTGIELEFLSNSDRKISSEARRIRCLRTPGWQRAWLVFKTPPNAAKVRVYFVLDSPKNISMEMGIDDPKLEPVPGPLADGRGRLRIWAFKDQRSTYARFSVKGPENGNHYPTFSFPFKDGRFYHLNDPNLNYLDLPPGPYLIKASRGPEVIAAERAVEIYPGQEKTIELRLEKEFSAHGWYGGDHHVHLFFHKGSIHPQMTIPDVMKIAKGEGLNFVSFCGEWGEFEDRLGNHHIAKDNDFVGQVGLESVNDFYGHMCTMGWKKIPEQGIPMRCVPWPMNTDTIESLISQGGAWVNAHPFDRITPGRIIENMGDPQKLCNARELPVILGLGYRTNFDILCHSTPGGAELKTSEYYRLLNMGFKVGVTASTDFYVDQARGTPGHNRTYVRSESLDFSSICEGYRLGRTYATNGPLIDFRLGNHQVGDEVRIPGEEELPVQIKSFSRMGLDRAKVILNGRTIDVMEAEGDWIREKISVPIEKSSWVAIHVQGPVDDDIEPWDLSPDQRNLQSQFCHTSPIYVQVEDEPIRPSKEDVDFLISWLDASAQAFHAVEGFWDGYPDSHYIHGPYSQEEKERITGAFENRIQKAKQGLRRLLE